MPPASGGLRLVTPGYREQPAATGSPRPILPVAPAAARARGRRRCRSAAGGSLPGPGSSSADRRRPGRRRGWSHGSRIRSRRGGSRRSCRRSRWRAASGRGSRCRRRRGTPSDRRSRPGRCQGCVRVERELHVLVDRPVAVVVEPVAHLRHSGVHAAQRVVAVRAATPGAVRCRVAALGGDEAVLVRVADADRGRVAVLVHVRRVADFIGWDRDALAIPRARLEATPLRPRVDTLARGKQDAPAAEALGSQESQVATIRSLARQPRARA